MTNTHFCHHCVSLYSSEMTVSVGLASHEYFKISVCRQDGPVYMAVNGVVFDVTSGKGNYYAVGLSLGIFSPAGSLSLSLCLDFDYIDL